MQGIKTIISPHFFYSKLAGTSYYQVRKSGFEIISSTDVYTEEWVIKFAFFFLETFNFITCLKQMVQSVESENLGQDFQ